MVLFTHLKIILLQYFHFLAVSKWALSTLLKLQETKPKVQEREYE